MLRVEVNTRALGPMLDWLNAAKTAGVRDERALREILSMEEYRLEFARYGMKGLPVCGISLEEAVDFFLNFDRKDFENPRLQIKKESFLPFYGDMSGSLRLLRPFLELSREDTGVIETLLKNGLPEDLLNEDLTVQILLLVSIGNSFGWPYGNTIDFDLANLGYVDSKECLLHLIAHELHHFFFDRLIPKDPGGGELFLLNFAYEGLAVHFANNQATVYKPAKYPGGTFCMAEEDMALYERDFPELFQRFREDWKAARDLSPEEVNDLVARHYEQFVYVSPKTGESFRGSQYPTYYLGCYFFGLIDHALGRERLFQALADPRTLADTYDQAVMEKGDPRFLLV